MKFGSVCSGIEAASAAWIPLGWECQFVSEIEPFPCAVLAHHHPEVPNRGDMTKFKGWPDATLDVLIGGTPCQSFSVAGLRKGLDDARGNLMLTFGEVAARFRPKWFTWENVPGVLSSGGGADFAAFLGLVTGQTVHAPAGGWRKSGVLPGIDSAYGVAWRILDAQYFGVAQRRRRVFVVGYLGDWRRAAAVLFESESMSGNPPPSRKTGEGFTRGVEIGPSGGSFTDLNPTLDSRAKDGPIRNQLAGAVYQPHPHAPISPAIKARDGKGVSSDGDGDGAILVPMVAHSLRAEHDASEDGTGRGTPLVPVGMTWRDKNGLEHWPEPVVFSHQAGGVQTTLGYDPESGTTPTLNKSQIAAVAYPIDLRNAGRDPEKHDAVNRQGVGTGEDGDPAGTVSSAFVPGVAVAFAQNTRDEVREMAVVGALAAEPGMKQTSYIRQTMQVRRLTPRECERLQGFPDDYTAIPMRGKPAADGPRYKALGNSMAVPCIAWIGRRIEMVDSATPRPLGETVSGKGEGG